MKNGTITPLVPRAKSQSPTMAKLRSAKQRRAPTRYSPDPPFQQSKATKTKKKTAPKAIGKKVKAKAKKAPPSKKKGRKPAASKAKKPAVEAQAPPPPPPQKTKERKTKNSQGLRTSPAPTEAGPSNASRARPATSGPSNQALRAPSAHPSPRDTSRPPSLSLAPSRRSLSDQSPIKREMKSKSPEVDLGAGRSSAPSPEPC